MAQTPNIPTEPVSHPVFPSGNGTALGGHIAALLAQAGAHSPDALANQVALLFEGAIASMLVGQNPEVAVHARDAAAVLMRAAGIALHPW